MKTNNTRTVFKNNKRGPWCAIFRGESGKAVSTVVEMHTDKLDNLEMTPLHSLPASSRIQKTVLKNKYTGRCNLLYP